MSFDQVTSDGIGRRAIRVANPRLMQIICRKDLLAQHLQTIRQLCPSGAQEFSYLGIGGLESLVVGCFVGWFCFALLVQLGSLLFLIVQTQRPLEQGKPCFSQEALFGVGVLNRAVPV